MSIEALIGRDDWSLGDLKSAIKSSALADYGWIKLILESTLNEYTVCFFRTSIIDSGRHDPFSVYVNLSAAGDLIGKCLQRRTQIQDIESQALTSALQFLLEQSEAESVDAMNALTFRGLKKQLSLSENDAPRESLVSESAVMRQFIVDARLKMHDIKGSSLNYGERSSFLRRIYCENLLNAVGHLEASREVLRQGFGVETEAVPIGEDWDGDPEPLLWWLRDVSYRLDTGSRHERTQTYYFPVMRLASLNRPPHHAWSELLNNGNVTFEITSQIISNLGIPMAGAIAHRIVGVGVGLAMDTYFPPLASTPDEIQKQQIDRDRWGLTTQMNRYVASISAITRDQLNFFDPYPHGAAPVFDDDEALIPEYPCIVEGIMMWTTETAMVSVMAGDPGRLMNASPIGHWNVALNCMPAHPDFQHVDVKALVGVGPPFGNSMRDMFLALTIASRPYV